jgi:hypothetical protein
MRIVREHITATGSLIVLALLTVGAVVVVVSSSNGSPVDSPASSPDPASATRTAAVVPGSALICGNPSSLTAMALTRSDPFPQNQIAFVFPARVVGSDGPAIAALDQTMCRLPAFPSGTFHCPADFGISYLIAFTSGARPVGTVTVTASGCPRLTGLGPARSPSTTFWAQLAVALDLSTPRPYCDPFVGRLPTDSTQCGALLS